MRTTLYRMTVFAVVCQEGAFARAARVLGTAKSAVSQHIRDLEEELGVKLIHRNARRLSITPAGERYLPYCQSLLETYEQARLAMDEETQGARGTLVITAPHGLIETWVTPALKTYVDDHPQVRVELITDDHRRHLVEDRIDLALRVGPLADSSDHAKKIGHTEEIFCAHPEYIDRMQGPPASLAALETWAHVASHWQSDPIEYQGHLNQTQERLVVTPRLRASSLSTTLTFLRTGLGVALVPHIAVSPELTSGRLVRLLGDYDFGQNPIHALHPYGRTAPLKVRHFIQCLESLAPS